MSAKTSVQGATNVVIQQFDPSQWISPTAVVADLGALLGGGGVSEALVDSKRKAFEFKQPVSPVIGLSLLLAVHAHFG